MHKNKEEGSEKSKIKKESICNSNKIVSKTQSVCFDIDLTGFVFACPHAKKNERKNHKTTCKEVTLKEEIIACQKKMKEFGQRTKDIVLGTY